MRLTACASAAIEPLLAAPVRPTRVLGAMDTAIYLEVDDAVIGVLTADAVRLPCAVVLDIDSRQRSLVTLAPVVGEPVLVGGGQLQWTGAIGAVGAVVIRVSESWAPATVGRAAAGWRSGIDELRRAGESVDIEVAPPEDPDTLVGLLGLGPGLTPSGDDLLAGYLLGARAFGSTPGPVALAISDAIDGRPARTTALSAQLLRHALAGQCAPEVAAVLAALPDPLARADAIAALLAIGHTSGAALARGLVLAAQSALTGAGSGR